MSGTATATNAPADAPDPRENRTGVEEGELPLSPEAKAIVGQIEAKVAELRNAKDDKLKAYQEESAEALNAAKKEFKERADALMNEVIDLEVQLQRMRGAEISAHVQGRSKDPEEQGAVAALGWPRDPRDRQIAHIQVHDDDPRESKEWVAALNSWFRNEKDAIPPEHRQVIYDGNKFARERLDPKNTLSSDFGPGAGVWVAPTIERTVTRRLVEFNPIRNEARVVAVGGPYYQGVIRTTRRDTIKGGGERELFADPATEERRYELIKIPVNSLRVRPALTQDSLDDATMDLAAELREDLSLDFAVQEAKWFTTGDGSGGDDNGALGYAASTAYPEVNSGIADDLDHGSITKLMLDLRPFYRNSARSSYCLGTDALTKLMLEEDQIGRRIWQPSNQEGIPSRLNGFRWWEGIGLDDVEAGAHPVFFGDFFLAYRIVDRAGMRVIRDDVTKPPLVIFNMWRRVGGGPWLEEALRRLKIAA